MGLDAPQPGLGQTSRDWRAVPARAAARAAAVTPERMRMANRRRAGCGSSSATVRVFCPITQLGASGTIQPHSGHRVSVQ